MDNFNKLIEVFNKIDSLEVDCPCFYPKENNAYFWLKTKEYKKSKYLILAKTANRIARKLYENDIDYTNVKLEWNWGDALKEKRIDMTPKIFIEFQVTDIEHITRIFDV
jgi:hypothetical protein